MLLIFYKAKQTTSKKQDDFQQHHNQNNRILACKNHTSQEQHCLSCFLLFHVLSFNSPWFYLLLYVKKIKKYIGTSYRTYLVFYLIQNNRESSATSFTNIFYNNFPRKFQVPLGSIIQQVNTIVEEFIFRSRK